MPTAQSNVMATAKQKFAYDRNNLHPLDVEARKDDDLSEGIDWDEILETTEDDFIAGRYAFSTVDYPDHERGMKAFREWTQSILKEVMRCECSATPRTIASR